jgi:hypothetical protein
MAQPPEQKPQQPFITPELLTKANLLGATLFILFGLSTMLIYFLLSIFDWGGLTRILLAMFIGPIIVSGLFGIWFVSQKPAILNANSLPLPPDETEPDQISES